MTEGAALLLKAKKYLTSAHLLSDAGDFDSAVSRIYYAGFYVAETLLDALGLSFSSHKAVISAYGQEFAQKNLLDPQFHRLLISAFEKRQQADYLAETGLDRDEVMEMLTGIEAFVRAAEDWLSSRSS